MEHVVDEILDGCGLSRANLIYSGGGHAYMLLPNTATAKDFLRAAQKRVNRWLMDNFGAALYLAFAWRECSAHELQNVPAEKAPYPQIFRDLSAELSRVKLSRYDAEALRALNSRGYDAGRECRVCGTSDDLTDDGPLQVVPALRGYFQRRAAQGRHYSRRKAEAGGRKTFYRAARRFR